MAYWRQWLIDHRKQHPRVEGNQKSDKAKMVKPRTMTGEELSSLRKRLGLYQREMASLVLPGDSFPGWKQISVLFLLGLCQN